MILLHIAPTGYITGSQRLHLPPDKPSALFRIRLVFVSFFRLACDRRYTQNLTTNNYSRNSTNNANVHASESNRLECHANSSVAHRTPPATLTEPAASPSAFLTIQAPSTC